jgi:hypothetical protein
MAEGRRTAPRQYWGVGWESPPGDEDGPPRCPECKRLMVKLWLRRRLYLQDKRKLVWSGFWFCNKCESINTASNSFIDMKLESDHHSPEWPDYPDEFDIDED